MDQSEIIQWLTLGGATVMVGAGALIWAIRLEGLVKQNTARLERGDGRLRELSERDDAVLRALNELRVAVARLEAKIDRNNGAE